MRLTFIKIIFSFLILSPSSSFTHISIKICSNNPIGYSFISLPVTIAAGLHLFPFRTEKLRPPAPMILHAQVCGKVGRHRLFFYHITLKNNFKKSFYHYLHSQEFNILELKAKNSCLFIKNIPNYEENII